MKLSVSLTVNGKPVSAEIESRTLLVDFLREQMRLTGTHVGCDTAQCGACTVLVNGGAVKSCNMLAIQARGCDVTTIEGVATNGTLHPMQVAFKQHHGLQCGFCTPGMVMTAEVFTPARIVGIASGSSTCKSVWRGVSPSAVAAWRRPGPTSSNPAWVFLVMGNSA